MRMSMLLAAGLLLCGAAGAGAQDVGAPPVRTFRVEVLHPRFSDADDDVSILTGGHFLSGSFPVGSGTALLVDLPFSYARVNGFFGRVTSKSIGNPFVGLGIDRGQVRLEGGVRLPLASEEEMANDFGMMADMVRMEAFAPDLVTVRGTAIWRSGGSDGLQSYFAGGPTMWLPTEGGDAELLIDYGAGLVYDRNGVLFSAGLNGKGIATEKGDVSERTMHQAMVTAGYAFGSVRPGISWRKMLDEDYDELSGTFGVFLEVRLR